jgi:hypothetical protein
MWEDRKTLIMTLQYPKGFIDLFSFKYSSGLYYSSSNVEILSTAIDLSLEEKKIGTKALLAKLERKLGR